MPIARIEGNHQGATLGSANPIPSDGSSITRKGVRWIDGLTHNYPAEIRRLGGRLTALHDFYCYDGWLLRLRGAISRRHAGIQRAHQTKICHPMPNYGGRLEPECCQFPTDDSSLLFRSILIIVPDHRFIDIYTMNTYYSIANIVYNLDG